MSTLPIHVAFIDDEESMHTLVKIRFKKLIKNHEISTYHFMDGSECLSYLRANKELLKIIILFSDISMPNMDGLTLAGIVRNEFPNIEMYVASALTETGLKEKASELGVIDFFSKPINFDVIENILKKHM